MHGARSHSTACPASLQLTQCHVILTVSRAWARSALGQHSKSELTRCTRPAVTQRPASLHHSSLTATSYLSPAGDEPLPPPFVYCRPWPQRQVGQVGRLKRCQATGTVSLSCLRGTPRERSGPQPGASPSGSRAAPL